MIKSICLKLIFLLLAFCSFSSIVSASTLIKAPSNLGLVGYWSFNEGGGAIVHDFSGNNFDGAINGSSTFVPGKIGYGLSVPQDNNSGFSASAGSALNNSSAATISFWINRAVTLGGDKVIVGFNNASPNAFYFTASTDTGMYVNIGSAAGYYNSVATGWHHVVVVFSAGTLTNYLDGQQAGHFNWFSGSAPSTLPSSLGSFSVISPTGYGAAPIVDDIHLYSRALSAAEVVALYNPGTTATMNRSAAGSGTLGQGLVGYWTMDGSTISGTTVADQSGQGNNGTMVNSPTPVLGKMGQALSFNTESQYVSVSPSTTLSGNMTFAAWLKPTANNGNNTFFWGRNSGGSNTDIKLSNLTGLHSDIGNGSSFVTTSADASYGFALGNWYHVVYAITTTGYSIYVNGNLVGSGSYSASSPQLWNSSSSFDIGSDSGGSGEHFSGSIDDVRIYNRALSAGEVTQLYNQGAGTHVNHSNAGSGSLGQGLVGYWTFDGPTISGTTLADQSGQGNNGTMVNSPTPVIGKMGQALSFNGSSYVNISDSTPSDLSLSTLTVSAWVYVPSGMCVGGSGDVEFVDAGAGNGSDGFQFGCDQQAIKIYRNIGGNEKINADNYTVPHNTWSLMTFTATGNTVNFYLNGVAQTTSGSWSGGINSYTGDVFRIGDNYGWTGSGFGPIWLFTGKIDDVRVYNRVLSATEVSQLYNMGK